MYSTALSVQHYHCLTSTIKIASQFIPMSQNGEASTSSATRPSVPSYNTPEVPEHQRQVIDSCTSVVQYFRAGRISKPKASISLQQCIPHDNADENIFLSIYEPYFDMLNNFERYQKGNIRGIGEVQRQLGESSTDEQNVDHGQSADEAHVARASKRPCSPASDDGDDEYEKRTHLDYGSLPWNEPEDLSCFTSENLSPSLQKTHTLLENFSRDVKRARSSLLNCNLPIPQFPPAEWLNLLNGNAVDLDHVFSNIYTISYDTRDVVELSKDVELLHGSSAPAKTVKTHSDWVIARDCFVDTVLFIFKHRKQELRSYGKHIQQYFASLPSQLHSWGINYDRAIRIRVAQQRDIELSNFAEFADLQIQWINNPANPATNQFTESRSKQNTNRQRTAACRRWNDNRCPNTPSNCNYLHVCSKCSNSGHVASSCTSLNKK